ncbi:hypothetical protein Aduo_013834 [Ancylostoma duodenale]
MRLQCVRRGCDAMYLRDMRCGRVSLDVLTQFGPDSVHYMLDLVPPTMNTRRRGGRVVVSSSSFLCCTARRTQRDKAPFV